MGFIARTKSILQAHSPNLYHIAGIAKARARRVLYRWNCSDVELKPFCRKEGLFGGKGSAAGVGSDFVETGIIRREIPMLVRELNITSILDAPCGDFYWMRAANLNVSRYIGADVAEDFIAQNKKKYGSDTREFVVLNILQSKIPLVDLILCRDFLVHLSFKDISRAIKNFKASGSRYLLTTTFPGTDHNIDIVSGRWRPLNLMLPPFNFSQPIRSIGEFLRQKDEKHTKSLGLWKLNDIP